MQRQLEYKIRVADVPAVRQVTQRVATQHGSVQQQIETHFYFTHGSLRLCETIGRRPALIWSSLIRNATASVSERLVAELAVPARIETLKRQMSIRAVVARHRETFVYRDVRIHLDDELELGAYLALQIVLSIHRDECAALTELDCLRTELGLGNADPRPRSYSDQSLLGSRCHFRAR